MNNAELNNKVRLAIVGAGSRGSGYARLAHADGRAVIVAVAEPDAARRTAIAEEYGLGPDRVFSGWEELATHPRLADAVVIATQDAFHAEPAIAFAGLGYHILLEKPMAPTEAESIRIVNAAEDNGVMLAVCHVMRYSTYTQALKKILDSGEIGDIASVEHLEPVGWWHFAHSYVRGNWAIEAESSSMLMSKSCHDIDWLSYVIGRKVVRVSSFGSLLHFRPENKPAGATMQCWDCPVRDACAYSATRIYPRFLATEAGRRWPLQVLTGTVSAESVAEAIEHGPYGQCVYNGRNDVVDHQVVNLEYEGGITASFTVTAFTDATFRKSRIFGTRGYVEGDGVTLKVYDFLTDTQRIVETGTGVGATAADGHGGADGELVRTFINAVASHDTRHLTSGPRQSLESHQVVWAAERSRVSGQTVIVASGDAHVGHEGEFARG